MDEPINAGPPSGAKKPPPDLPKRLLDLWPVVIIGTAAWFVAFIVLLVTGHRDVWLLTTLCGVLLGFVGLPLILWQRAASRRGSRSAQRDL